GRHARRRADRSGRCPGPAPGTPRGAGRAGKGGDAEGQVQGLTAVEPGVARGLIPLAQVGFGDVLAAADALGDVVASELDVDAARMRAERAVHLEEARDLVQHVVEVPGLVAAGRLDRVAVHRVAYPHHGGPAGRH